MKLVKLSVLLALVVVLGGPAFAQVSDVIARTEKLSCGACGVISEIYLRRIDGLEAVNMSISKELVHVSLKSGTSFQPQDIRDALSRSGVDVVQLQIRARGTAQEQDGKRVFIAGNDKFVLVDSPNVVDGTMVEVEGIVNDRRSPMELKVLSAKPLTTPSGG